VPSGRIEPDRTVFKPCQPAANNYAFCLLNIVELSAQCLVFLIFVKDGSSPDGVTQESRDLRAFCPPPVRVAPGEVSRYPRAVSVRCRVAARVGEATSNRLPILGSGFEPPSAEATLMSSDEGFEIVVSR
jgi:hypothetical protein